MHQFVGIVRHEFGMSARRVGLWVPFGIIFLFFAFGLNTTTGEGMANMLTGRPTLSEAGEVTYMLNMLLTLVAGIVAADRAKRDVQLHLRELQLSSPLPQWKYVVGKYLGVLLASLLPALACLLLYGVTGVVIGLVAPVFILAELAAFATIVVPSFAFVTARRPPARAMAPL